MLASCKSFRGIVGDKIQNSILRRDFAHEECSQVSFKGLVYQRVCDRPIPTEYLPWPRLV